MVLIHNVGPNINTDEPKDKWLCLIFFFIIPIMRMTPGLTDYSRLLQIKAL